MKFTTKSIFKVFEFRTSLILAIDLQMVIPVTNGGKGLKSTLIDLTVLDNNSRVDHIQQTK